MKNETEMKEEIKNVMMNAIEDDEYFKLHEKPSVRIFLANDGVKEISTMKPMVEVYNGKQMTLNPYIGYDGPSSFQAMDVSVNLGVFKLYNYMEALTFIKLNAIRKYKKLQLPIPDYRDKGFFTK
tara:strand:+ start:34 stop:408 length:375 start_codon:yes stop_codon:yes gene_type:complete